MIAAGLRADCRDSATCPPRAGGIVTRGTLRLAQTAQLNALRHGRDLEIALKRARCSIFAHRIGVVQRARLRQRSDRGSRFYGGPTPKSRVSTPSRAHEPSARLGPMRSRLPLFDALAAPLTVSANDQRSVATSTQGGVDTIVKRAPNHEALNPSPTRARETVRVRTHAACKRTRRFIVVAAALILGGCRAAGTSRRLSRLARARRIGGRAGGRVALSAGGGL